MFRVVRRPVLAGSGFTQSIVSVRSIEFDLVIGFGGRPRVTGKI
jgi:hypothetical protein